MSTTGKWVFWVVRFRICYKSTTVLIFILLFWFPTFILAFSVGKKETLANCVTSFSIFPLDLIHWKENFSNWMKRRHKPKALLNTNSARPEKWILLLSCLALLSEWLGLFPGTKLTPTLQGVVDSSKIFQCEN